MQTEPDMFGGPTVEDVTLEAQMECVRREIGMRESVYPRRIADGRMSRQDAEREILTMRAVLRTLELVGIRA